MDATLSAELITKTCPSAAVLAADIVAAASAWKITEAEELADWLASWDHESGAFLRLSENLNYGAAALEAMWGPQTRSPKFATAAECAIYARNPQKIANRIYAGRSGNGDEASGDGWKYRGRGLPQLTFANNYKAYSQAAHGDFRCFINPDLLLLPLDACGAAGWFWYANKIGQITDKGGADAFTRRSAAINCGSPDADPKRINGLDDRRARRVKWRAALGLGH